MKTSVVIVVLTVLAAQAQAALTLPEGNYKGQGLWKSVKEQGSYDVHASISKDTISETYVMQDGSKKDWTFQITEKANNFFTVSTHGLEVGEGYCLEKAQVCHYEIKINDFRLEETLTSLDGRLYRFGSKIDSGTKVFWQEGLDKE